jgi:hypothetical protein
MRSMESVGPTATAEAVSGVSWGAIIAGGVGAAALTLVLLAFGTVLGLSVVSPWASSGVSGTTFSIGAGLYLIVVAMMSSSIGGYLAGRLRTKWSGVHSDEVYFRDTAHGFLAWAFATVLGVSVLAAGATHIAAGAVAGVGQGVSTAGAQSAEQSAPMAGWLDKLLRSAPTAASADARAAGDDRFRAELGRLLASGLARGADVTAADRTYIAQIVAARTGSSQADAEKRVADVITEAKAAADAARRSARNLAAWLTASLLIGAFSASLAATEGGAIRDGTWKWLRRSNI